MTLGEGVLARARIGEHAGTGVAIATKYGHFHFGVGACVAYVGGVDGDVVAKHWNMMT